MEINADVGKIILSREGVILEGSEHTIGITLTGNSRQLACATPVVERCLVRVGRLREEHLSQGTYLRSWRALPPSKPLPAPESFEQWLLVANVPAHLRSDRYWRALLYIFSRQPTLRAFLSPAYFNFEQEEVEVKKLQRLPLGSGLEFMVQLALHLFNDRHPINLAALAGLDAYNYDLAMEAINIRFK